MPVMAERSKPFVEYEAEEHNDPQFSTMDNSREASAATNANHRRGFGRHSNYHGPKGSKGGKLSFKTRMEGAAKYPDYEATRHPMVTK